MIASNRSLTIPNLPRKYSENKQSIGFSNAISKRYAEHLFLILPPSPHFEVSITIIFIPKTQFYFDTFSINKALTLSTLPSKNTNPHDRNAFYHYSLTLNAKTTDYQY